MISRSWRILRVWRAGLISIRETSERRMMAEGIGPFTGAFSHAIIDGMVDDGAGGGFEGRDCG